MDDLIERLRAAAPEGLTAAHVSDLAAVREAADEIHRLRSAVLWALGYDQGEPEFTSRPEGAGAYWWRSELRRRAGITE